jgi:hypothetical protein
MRTYLAIGCLVALPLIGQTTTTSSSTSNTSTTNNNTTSTTATAGTATTGTTTTGSTTTTKKSSRATRKATTANRSKVWNDSTRLASLLSDAQNKAAFSADVWRVSANEANSLANRIYASTGGRSQAAQLRTHVRQMRDAALKGDAEGARTHASEALPFAYQLIDWSSPKSM